MNTAGLSAICNGFGYREEDVDGTLLGYVKSEYCLDNLKDLQRFLRRDDPVDRYVFKQICKWNVVSRDLIPTLENYQSDRNLVINTVKILVFLTMPVDPLSDDIPQQIEYLWQLKAALARNVTVAVIVSLLEEPLEHLEREAFTEDDWKLVQLVLTFFRNVLAIQDILLQQKASGSSSQYLQLRDGFVEILFDENVMDLILVLTQHVDDSRGYLRQDNFLLLEFFHYTFQGHEPELIAKASDKRSKVNEVVSTSINSLRSIMDEEEEKRRPTGLKNLEYSNFSGTFSRFAIDGSKTLLKGNPATASSNILLKAHKVQRGPLKRIVWDSRNLLSPKENVMELLCNFLNNLLSGGYNVLMQSIYEDIEKEHHAVQNSDIITFFQVACFVTAFQRHKFVDTKPRKIDASTSEDSPVNGISGNSFIGVICGPIAVTMNEGMLFLLISKWRHAFDSLKETKDYKCLSSAGSLMKNMIRMLDLVLKVLPEDSNEHKMARILLYKVFYDQTDQGFCHFLLSLIKSFDTHKQPKSDLVDLLEIMHVVLRLMESLQERGAIRVSKKSRKRRAKKAPSANNSTEAEKTIDEHTSVVDIHDLNCGNEQSHSKIVEDLNESINKHLTHSFSIEDECVLAPNPIVGPNMHPPEPGHLGNDSSQMLEKTNCGLNDKGHGAEDSSNDEHQSSTNEVDFNVSKLVSDIANGAAVQNLCWLLKFCKSNSASTNYYIICMLRRICDDLELSPLLYQLSFLTIFYDIIADQKTSKKCPDVVYFLTKLVRNMMKKIKTQPLLFVEILFWKTRRECHLINAEGLTHDLHNMREKIKALGIEGVCFSKEFGQVPQKSLAESLGEDEADLIPHNLNHQWDDILDEDLQNNSDNTKENEEEGKGEDSDKSSKDRLSQRTSGKQKNFDLDEQDMIIRNLYEKFKHNKRCSHLIAEALDPHGKVSRIEVSRMLRKLGLKIASRKKGQHIQGSFSAVEDQVALQGKELASDASIQNSKGLEISAFSNSSFNRKKRVQAFSEQQELMIRDLFQQFKNHKRCSHMIANALDVKSTYSAAQVSRKLKQLGLLPLKKKRYDDAKSSGPLEFSDKGNSDEETLLTMMERKRNKKRKMLGKEVAKLSIRDPGPVETSLHEDGTDDELISTMLQKSSKRISQMEKFDGEQYHSEGRANNNVTTGIHQYDKGRESLDESMQMQSHTVEDAEATNAALDDNLEDELDGGVEKEHDDLTVHGSSDTKSDNLEMQDRQEELADSGDDVGSIAPRKVGMRRKLKMVIDVEDDD